MKNASKYGENSIFYKTMINFHVHLFKTNCLFPLSVGMWRIILILPNCRIFRNEYSDSRITKWISHNSDSFLRITKWSYKNSDSWRSVHLKFGKIRKNSEKSELIRLSPTVNFIDKIYIFCNIFLIIFI